MFILPSIRAFAARGIYCYYYYYKFLRRVAHSAMAAFQEALRLSTCLQYLNKELHKIQLMYLVIWLSGYLAINLSSYYLALIGISRMADI